jgi:hypothetical protein
MLKQEVAFIKALSSIEFSPVFLRELRKAVVAGKNKKALVATKASGARALALDCPSVVGGEARTSRDSLQLHVSKRKAEELSTSHCPSEPASRCTASGQPFGDGPEAQGTTGQLAPRAAGNSVRPRVGCHMLR